MPSAMEVQETYQKGFELRCEGRYSEAKVELNKVLAAEPRHLEARWQIGLIQGFEGDFDSSLNTLMALVAEAPQNVNIRYDLAMTEMMLGMNDEAATNFREILRLEPGHEKAQQQLTYF
jgi:thioredoxin-like negative regulator of GroEL